MTTPLRTQTVLICLLLACCAGEWGCAQHQYLLKLKNGDEIVSSTKPKLQGTNYHFTDSAGAKHAIPQNRVAKIRSGSMVSEEAKPAPAATPVKTSKPRHWYFLWLAECQGSRQFLAWYQRLIQSNAHSTVEAFNAQLRPLEAVLPQSATLLREAIAQAQGAPTD